MGAMNTYDRYRHTLQQIAEGVDDPQALALEALKPQGTEPTYKWKREQEASAARAKARREARKKYCAELYQEWLEAGRPPIAKFARDKGKSSSSTEMALKQHERRAVRPYEKQYLLRAESERAIKRNEKARRKWEETHKDHMIRVRYFDREESAEALAAELGWTMEQMRAFIEAARMDKWVTTTEYNLHWKELVAKYGPKT